MSKSKVYSILPNAKLYLALLFVGASPILSSCGGGGGTKTLTVDFSYSQSDVQLWKPASISILATGLDGNTPNCQILTGQLPSGLALQSVGCAIVGTPTEVTSRVDFTIRLTVPGFEGQVDKQMSILVFGPPMRYDLPPGSNGMLAGTPFSVTPIETNLNIWTPSPGESLRYEVASGILPDGLTLDPLTGRISGVITARTSDVAHYSIGVTTTSPQGTYSSTSLPQSVSVFEGLRIDYPGDCFCRVGFYWTLNPIKKYALGQSAGEYQFSNFRIAPASGSLPPGFSIDPSTGVISGTPTASGAYRLQVLADVATGGQASTLSAGLYEWYVQP